jgi:hypothetical protein
MAIFRGILARNPIEYDSSQTFVRGSITQSLESLGR